MKFAAFAMMLAACAATQASAQAEPAPAPEPITIGQSHTLTALGAERHLNVVTPRGYEEHAAEYPLILVLDGGTDQDFFLALGLERWNQLWGRSQPAIFVGVQTVDRQRELLPPTQDGEEQARYPTAGSSDEFRSWLGETALPLLRANYRHNGRVFLIGESAAGHFVAETWAKHPAMFDGYAALSPSLQWNDQSLSRDMAAMPAAKRPPLFISLADEGGATELGMQRFLASTGGNACFADRRASLRHSNSLHGLLPEALQYLLPTEADWLEEYGLTVNCDTAGGLPE